MLEDSGVAGLPDVSEKLWPSGSSEFASGPSSFSRRRLLSPSWIPSCATISRRGHIEPGAADREIGPVETIVEDRDPKAFWSSAVHALGLAPSLHPLERSRPRRDSKPGTGCARLTHSGSGIPGSPDPNVVTEPDDRTLDSCLESQRTTTGCL